MLSRCSSAWLLADLPCNELFSYLFLPPQDHDFFQHVEMHLRSEHPPLCGRDHLSFRSYYFPVKVGLSGWDQLVTRGVLRDLEPQRPCTSKSWLLFREKAC